MDQKYCVRCGVRYDRPSHCRGKRWVARMYCSPKCQRLSAVESSNRERVITSEGRAKMAENARRYLHNETPEQRKARMAKVLKNRVESGNWKPPGTGKIKDQNYSWLGDKATYNAKHRWIQKHWQKTGKCEECGKEPKPYGRRKWGTEWSNQDGLYNREDRSTWRELCKPCHRAYDSVRK